MASEAGFRLIIRKGPQPNQVYELTKDVVTLGRDITNDIVVNDPEVSRHHSRLTKTTAGYAIEDLGSTNGTLVNHRQTAGAQTLVNGDLVGIGETVTLSYEATAVPAQGISSTVAAPSPESPPGSGPLRAAPPIADEPGDEDSNLRRNIIIGCAVVAAFGCCIIAIAGGLVISGSLCETALELCV